MSCNCRKCNCQDRKLCFIIENRLKAIACILDKVSEKILDNNNSQIFSNFDAKNDPICPNDDEKLSDYFVLNKNGENNGQFVSLFADHLSSLPASALLPDKSVHIGNDWISTVICIPAPIGACVTCKKLKGCNVAICSINSNTCDYSNYSAIAQNLRYIASVYGYQHR